MVDLHKRLHLPVIYLLPVVNVEILVVLLLGDLIQLQHFWKKDTISIFGIAHLAVKVVTLQTFDRYEFRTFWASESLEAEIPNSSGSLK